MHNTVIYLGPTLLNAEASAILATDYRPPIRRGDLARLPKSVKFVGIVDGEFYHCLSVSTKEIVVLLRRGVRVFGAASMGALRAAETHTLGTVGVGKVFAMYRDGVLDADDEVAITYEADTYRTLSESMVNLRAGLEQAAAAGVIDVLTQERLITEMKAYYFPQRSWRMLERLCPALENFFRHTPRPDIKRDDARELLLAIKHARNISAGVRKVSQTKSITFGATEVENVI